MNAKDLDEYLVNWGLAYLASYTDKELKVTSKENGCWLKIYKNEGSYLIDFRTGEIKKVSYKSYLDYLPMRVSNVIENWSRA